MAIPGFIQIQMVPMGLTQLGIEMFVDTQKSTQLRLEIGYPQMHWNYKERKNDQQNIFLNSRTVYGDHSVPAPLTVSPLQPVLSVFVQAYLSPQPSFHNHSSYQNLRAALEFIFVLVHGSMFCRSSRHLDIYAVMPLGHCLVVVPITS